MIKFFHKLFNPHCEHCIEDELNKECKSCETLIRQLEIANREKELLLGKLLEQPKPVELVANEPVEYKPINRRIPWRMRRQMMETESRRAAALIKPSSNETIEKLENEVLKDGTDS